MSDTNENSHINKIYKQPKKHPHFCSHLMSDILSYMTIFFFHVIVVLHVFSEFIVLISRVMSHQCNRHMHKTEYRKNMCVCISMCLFKSRLLGSYVGQTLWWQNMALVLRLVKIIVKQNGQLQIHISYKATIQVC